MQKYLMKFSSTEECISYINYLRELGTDHLIFAYLAIDSYFPRYTTITEEECTLEVFAQFVGDPPEGFLDHVEVFPGFDPANMPA